MLSWIVSIIGLALSWHFADLGSTETLTGVVCPLLVGAFSIVLLVKFIFLPGSSSHGRSGYGDDGGGFFGGFDGGGDCGGGGDGGC